MENRSIGWEWISKIWVSIFLSCSPGLSLNFPLVAMARKTLHSCLVQLLLPSLPPQLPSPAQTGLRLLRFSISTHLKLPGRIQHKRASGGKDPCWTANQSTATALNTALGMSKAFFPRCSPANWVSKSSSKGEKLQIPLVTAPSFPEGVSQPPPSIPTHLLTGIWHKGAVDAEARKHLLLLFQRVRLGKAVQKQFCSKRKRREMFLGFLSTPPCSNHSSAIPKASSAIFNEHSFWCQQHPTHNSATQRPQPALWHRETEPRGDGLCNNMQNSTPNFPALAHYASCEMSLQIHPRYQGKVKLMYSALTSIWMLVLPYLDTRTYKYCKYSW